MPDFCNDRVAQAFGYEVFGGTRRHRQSALENIHDRFTWEQAVPVELLTLKHVPEQTLPIGHFLLDPRWAEGDNYR